MGTIVISALLNRAGITVGANTVLVLYMLTNGCLANMRSGMRNEPTVDSKPMHLSRIHRMRISLHMGNSAQMEGCSHRAQGRNLDRRSTDRSTPVRLARHAVPRTVGGTVEATIRRVAREHGVDARILLAMAYVESRYRPRAVGDGGQSFGILQIQPRWHGHDRQHWFDVENSARYCARWLRGGANIWERVRRWNGSGRASYAYVRRVRRAM